MIDEVIILLLAFAIVVIELNLLKMYGAKKESLKIATI